MIESKGAIPKEVLVPKKEEPKKLFLSHAESAQLAANTTKNDLIIADKKAIEVRKILLEAQENILKRDRIILEFSIKELNNTERIFKADNENFIVGITNKYDLLEHGNWGYDRNTGEIIIKEE